MRRGHLSQCVSPASLEFGSELELGVTGRDDDDDLQSVDEVVWCS